MRPLTQGQRAWVAARGVQSSSMMKSPTLGSLIDWKMKSPTVEHERSKTMQRQFTIEVRVDYADDGKNVVMKEAIQAAARHVYATASLLSDGVKPEIAVFSDDFFHGHEQIELLEDIIAKGKQQLDAAAGGTVEQSDPGVSQDLIDALKA